MCCYTNNNTDDTRVWHFRDIFFTSYPRQRCQPWQSTLHTSHAHSSHRQGHRGTLLKVRAAQNCLYTWCPQMVFSKLKFSLVVSCIASPDWLPHAVTAWKLQKDLQNYGKKDYDDTVILLSGAYFIVKHYVVSSSLWSLVYSNTLDNYWLQFNKCCV